MVKEIVFDFTEYDGCSDRLERCKSTYSDQFKKIKKTIKLESNVTFEIFMRKCVSDVVKDYYISSPSIDRKKITSSNMFYNYIVRTNLPTDYSNDYDLIMVCDVSFEGMIHVHVKRVELIKTSIQKIDLSFLKF